MQNPDQPRDHLTTSELAAAVEGNLFDLFRAMTSLPGSEIEEASCFCRHIAPPFNPMFKGVWQTRLASHGVDEAIDEVVAWFKARQAPFAFWWTGAATQPANLGEALLARGWTAHEIAAPGLVAELDQLDYRAMQCVPTGFTVERVSGQRQLDGFKQAFVAGLEVPEWAGQAWVDATLALGIAQAPWQLYVGMLDGEPVASNMLFNGGGVASVYGVATVPAVRRQGIGAAITLSAYQDALEMGYRYGVLFATEMAAPVYRRIGFRDCDARVSRYLRRNGMDLPRIGQENQEKQKD